MYQVSVEWTGKYPNLCSGEWIIDVNGVRLGGLGNDSMNTFGSYSSWHFENWQEVWEQEESGLACEDWVDMKDLPNNLSMSLRLAGFDQSDRALRETLFDAVKREDWRHGSCGGCI